MAFGRRWLVRFVQPLGFATCLVVLFGACQIQDRFKERGKRPTPLPEGVSARDVIDANEPPAALDTVDPNNSFASVFRERQVQALRERREQDIKQGKLAPGDKKAVSKEYNILALSGGGSMGRTRPACCVGGRRPGSPRKKAAGRSSTWSPESAPGP
ncbi:hypothetical protein [Fimbriiglobus ruber]|uniref:Uncharacterized protein n=1 Tax=Fimbriiglobus ruber TaxID=1908690 RepID=A0A225DPF4_9BACT|nr:hypothetical protein [Fimbriiglobus ruber]OWK38047.1 hypothetical protein FRUB_07167 [Fimbriiglobus ruber]